MSSKKTMPVAMANHKSIGYMPYSLRPQVINPGDAESSKKIAAVAQRWETVDLTQLSQHIHEHNSQFSKGVIIGVLTDMVECIKEQLSSGNFVKLDGLCTMGYSYSCQLADSATDFNPANDITRINCRTKFDSDFEVLLNVNAKFILVDTRDEQAAANRAKKAALNDEIGYVPPTDGDDTGGSGSGGSSGSGGDDSGVTE